MSGGQGYTGALVPAFLTASLRSSKFGINGVKDEKKSASALGSEKISRIHSESLVAATSKASCMVSPETEPFSSSRI